MIVTFLRDMRKKKSPVEVGKGGEGEGRKILFPRENCVGNLDL